MCVCVCVSPANTGGLPRHPLATILGTSPQGQNHFGTTGSRVHQATGEKARGHNRILQQPSLGVPREEGRTGEEEGKEEEEEEKGIHTSTL